MRFHQMIPVFASAFVIALAPAAKAQNNCKLDTLKGSYGYTVVGTINPDVNLPPFVPGPFSAVGRITFDGHGNVFTVRTFSDNGNVITGDTGKGTYSISKDCTGSFNVTVTAPGVSAELTLTFVLDDTNEIRAIVTNQGFVLTLQGRKQHSSGNE